MPKERDEVEAPDGAEHHGTAGGQPDPSLDTRKMAKLGRWRARKERILRVNGRLSAALLIVGLLVSLTSIGRVAVHVGAISVCRELPGPPTGWRSHNCTGADPCPAGGRTSSLVTDAIASVQGGLSRGSAGSSSWRSSQSIFICSPIRPVVPVMIYHWLGRWAECPVPSGVADLGFSRILANSGT